MGPRSRIILHVAERHIIYAPSEDGNLYALNQDGTLLWSRFLKAEVFSPTIDASGNIIVVTNGTCVAWKSSHSPRVEDYGAGARRFQHVVTDDAWRVYANSACSIQYDLVLLQLYAHLVY